MKPPIAETAGSCNRQSEAAILTPLAETARLKPPAAEAARQKPQAAEAATSPPHIAVPPRASQRRAHAPLERDGGSAKTTYSSVLSLAPLFRAPPSTPPLAPSRLSTSRPSAHPTAAEASPARLAEGDDDDDDGQLGLHCAAADRLSSARAASLGGLHSCPDLWGRSCLTPGLVRTTDFPPLPSGDDAVVAFAGDEIVLRLRAQLPPLQPAACAPPPGTPPDDAIASSSGHVASSSPAAGGSRLSRSYSASEAYKAAAEEEAFAASWRDVGDDETAPLTPPADGRLTPPADGREARKAARRWPSEWKTGGGPSPLDGFELLATEPPINTRDAQRWPSAAAPAISDTPSAAAAAAMGAA